jgi:hypothetical protein
MYLYMKIIHYTGRHFSHYVFLCCVVISQTEDVMIAEACSYKYEL